jgi:tetratricopeptide (TPR) repeat protein
MFRCRGLSSDFLSSCGCLWLGLILVSIFLSPSFCQQASKSKADSASDPALEAGISLAQKGDFTGAEKAFEQVVANHPRDARALTALGQVQDQLGQLSESIENFRKVIVLDPLSPDAHVNLGIALGDQADLAGALQEGFAATRLAPGSAGAHFLCGRLLSDLGRRAEAREEFRTVLDISPDYAEALNYWAALEGDEGDKVQQARLLKRYVKLRPDNATAWVKLGSVLDGENRQSEAIAAWRHAVALNPRYIEAIYSLARALKGTDPAESKQLIERIHELEHDQQTIDRIKVLGNKANAEMSGADYKEAINDLHEGIVLCGSCELLSTLEKNLGLAYCHAGQLDAGERELKIAKKLNPEDSSVEEALAVVKQQREQAQTVSR